MARLVVSGNVETTMAMFCLFGNFDADWHRKQDTCEKAGVLLKWILGVRGVQLVFCRLDLPLC